MLQMVCIIKFVQNVVIISDTNCLYLEQDKIIYIIGV